MSLKDLISTLIESAFTSKKVFIANTSAPNWTGKITIYNGTSANPVTQTAPADGYYQQHVNGYPSQGYNDISAPNETRAFVANMPESSAMIRVAKGDKVVMSVLSFDSIISRTIAFIPCIGGGLRSIIQSGGALCLRLKTIFNRCSNSLARKQCLEEAIWALLKPCNLIRHLIGSLLRKGILLLRVTIVFSGWQFKQCGAVNTRIDSLSMRIPECIQAFHTLAQKGRLLESQLARQQVRAKITRFISSTQILSARLSFAQGVCHG